MPEPVSPAHPGRSGGWWIWGLFAVWVLEVFAVQELTLIPPHSRSTTGLVLDRVFRLVLDVLAIGAILKLLPRRFLPLAIVATMVWALSLSSFDQHFGRPLSALILESNAGEGIRVLSSALGSLSGIHLLWAGLAGVQLAILRRLRVPTSPAREARGRRLLRAGGLLGAWVASIAVLNTAYKPLGRLVTWESTAGVGAVYGYAPTWVAELALFDNAEYLARALARAEAVDIDRLTPVETPLAPADRVVFLQVESLDWSLLDFTIDGREVTPRLNDLRDRSRTYRVRAPKITGSLDSDFTALMARAPAADVPVYKIAGYPFRPSLPGDLAGAGYDVAAFHGVSGEFFDRRDPFVLMGFTRLFFREELTRGLRLASAGWSVPDDAVLEAAAADLARQCGKWFQMIITASSHSPFHHMPTEDPVFFPRSGDLAHNYLDVMHYVDEAIGEYVDSLPAGTLLVLYGDHSSGVEREDLGYRETLYRGVGVVPLFLYRAGDDLAGTSTAPPSLTGTGALTLLEAMRYVHRHIRPLRTVGPAAGGRGDAAERGVGCP